MRPGARRRKPSNKFNAALRAALEDPTFTQKMAGLGAVSCRIGDRRRKATHCKPGCNPRNQQMGRRHPQGRRLRG